MKSILFFFSALVLISCTEAQNKPVDLNVAEFVTAMDAADDKTILDVRTPQEWQGGIIPNAVTMDFYSDSFPSDLKTLDTEKPIFVYCKSGGRSGKAAAMLEELGFKNVYNLVGGITAWKGANKTTVAP